MFSEQLKLIYSICTSEKQKSFLIEQFMWSEQNLKNSQFQSDFKTFIIKQVNTSESNIFTRICNLLQILTLEKWYF